MDSRRLTGPNWLWQYPGAILEVALGLGEDADTVVQAWRNALLPRLGVLGLEARTVRREYPSGLSLAFAAPIDALYTAVRIGELAFQEAQARLVGEPLADLEARWAEIASELALERDPKLLALEEQARAKGINLCGDDEFTTLGMGANGRSFATDALPDPASVDWDSLRDIPCVMVTGTNGKSTTVRLLVAIATAAGLVPGASSTDWIQIGEELVDRDDWSGPGGARAVLKDPRVQVAILETARGGILRRGLAVPRVDVAVITNVATDHMGELGVHSLADLTEVKFVVRRVAEHLVLNADDPEVRRRGSHVERPVIWVSLHPDDALIQAHLAAGGKAALLLDGDLVLCSGSARERLLAVKEVPLTLAGIARYNITNALCAAAAAWQLRLPLAALRQGLATFQSDPTSNPGRLNVFALGDVQVLVDFAHNPHGMRAILDLVKHLPHKRTAVLLGQAGDRDNESIIELARITAAAKPDLVIVKHMTKHLRGRAEGEVVRLIWDTLLEAGLSEANLMEAPSEAQAAQQALAWAQAGDLVLLLCHAEREEVIEWLTKLQVAGWRAGQPLPPFPSV